MDMSQPVDKAYLTDAANAQEVYGKLSFISDSQASDERLWAGMCLGPFYEYTQYPVSYTHLLLNCRTSILGEVPFN